MTPVDPSESDAGLVASERDDDLDAQRLLARVRHNLAGVQSDPVEVGRYALEDKIGAGVAGVVYAARAPELDRRIAIKLLDGDPRSTLDDGVPAPATADSLRARVLCWERRPTWHPSRRTAIRSTRAPISSASAWRCSRHWSGAGRSRARRCTRSWAPCAEASAGTTSGDFRRGCGPPSSGDSPRAPTIVIPMAGWVLLGAGPMLAVGGAVTLSGGEDADACRATAFSSQIADVESTLAGVFVGPEQGACKGSDRPVCTRARTLAQDARERYLALGPALQPQVDALDAWVPEHL